MAQPAITTPGPRVIEANLRLTREERAFVQRALNARNYKAGTEDGLFGVRTREAIRRYQSRSGLPMTGYLTANQAKTLIAKGRKVAIAPASKSAPTATQTKALPGTGTGARKKQQATMNPQDENVNLPKQNVASDPIPTSALVVKDVQFGALINGEKLMLEGLIVRPRSNHRLPLVVFAHGSIGTESRRKNYAPIRFLPQAEEFARRGYVAFVPNRRGYGKSQGQWAESRGECESPDYMKPTLEAAKDLAQAVRYGRSLPYVDGERVLLLGVSGGGMPVLALLSQKTPGIVGSIIISGIRGSRKDEPNCDKKQLLNVIQRFGQNARTPSLWIYVKNDRSISPDLPEAMHQRYTSAGGRALLVFIDAYRSDGHNMFYRNDAIPLWRYPVDTFLRSQSLPTWKSPPEEPTYRKLPPPIGLRDGDSAWDKYLIRGPHKAFAIDPSSGEHGYATRRRTLAEAKESALKYCGRPTCEIVSADDVDAIALMRKRIEAIKAEGPYENCILTDPNSTGANPEYWDRFLALAESKEKCIERSEAISDLERRLKK